MKLLNNNLKILLIIMFSLLIIAIINIKTNKIKKYKNLSKKFSKETNLEQFEKEDLIQNFNKEINYLENKMFDTIGYQNNNCNCIC